MNFHDMKKTPNLRHEKLPLARFKTFMQTLAVGSTSMPKMTYANHALTH